MESPAVWRAATEMLDGETDVAAEVGWAAAVWAVVTFELLTCDGWQVTCGMAACNGWMEAACGCSIVCTVAAE